MSVSFASEDITGLASKFTPSAFYMLKSRFPDVDHSTLARFLIARNGDIDKASLLLNAHLAWRSTNLPITKASCLNELYKGKVYGHGVDKEGHPLVVYVPRFNDPSVRDLEEMSRSLLYWTEHVLENMPANKSKATILVDRTGNSQPDMDFIKFVAKAFQDNYPERAYRFIIYPGGIVFTTLWNIIRLFIDPVTANKVKVVMWESGVKEYIEDKYIPVSCGGKCTFEHSKLLIDSMPAVLPAPVSSVFVGVTTAITSSGGEVTLGGDSEKEGEEHEDGDESFQPDVKI